MIELIPGEGDDLDFLALVQHIVNGAVSALDVREVFLVHVDTWFDFKWLGFCHSRREELCVPTFERNRIRSERAPCLGRGSPVMGEHRAPEAAPSTPAKTEVSTSSLAQ